MTVVQEWHQVSKVGIRFLGDSLPGVTLAMILAAVSRLSFLSFSMSVPPPPGVSRNSGNLCSYSRVQHTV